MLAELLVFIQMVIVSGRNVYYQQTHEQVPSYIEAIIKTNYKVNEEYRRLREIEKISNINTDVRVHGAIGHGSQLILQATNMFSNEQRRHEFNGKYIENINPNVQNEAMSFYDDIDYSRKPFTNKRPTDIENSNEPKKEPNETPNRQTQTNISYAQVRWNTSCNTLPKLENNMLKSKNVENEPNHNNIEEATTLEVELDNRVAFTGDECATGFSKVNGKCVKEQK